MFFAFYNEEKKFDCFAKRDVCARNGTAGADLATNTKFPDLMKNQPPIVVGIDFSDSSPILLRHAQHAAAANGVKVLAMHVLDQGMREYRKLGGTESPEYKALVADAEERFAKLLPPGAQQVETEFRVKAGKPADELARLIKEEGATFLIVSANDMTKKRLGSVAARAVRTVDCDVLIMRDWQGGGFLKIVVCVDFSATSDRAVVRAAKMAEQFGASLEIIHVMYPPELDNWGRAMYHPENSPKTYEEECRAAVWTNMDRLRAKHAAFLQGVNYEVKVLESQIATLKITNYVRDSGADLVVLGTHGNSGFSSYFIGTNAERLIQDAPVSVFAVR